jgi:uracil-DNA glycosylase
VTTTPELVHEQGNVWVRKKRFRPAGREADSLPASSGDTAGVLTPNCFHPSVKNVAESLSNPFGFDPGCESFVPGYGDANAHFHVVGDHPGVHGGVESGVPFTGSVSGERLQRALAEAGMLESAGNPPTVDNTYLSYLHMCHADGTPSQESYDDLEPLFDSEFRAITAHVLLPVDERATRHVFAVATAEPTDDVDMERRHATEVMGSGWLVYPIKEPAEWNDGDEAALVEALKALQETDYRREADLGRFGPTGETYLVR